MYCHFWIPLRFGYDFNLGQTVGATSAAATQYAAAAGVTMVGGAGAGQQVLASPQVGQRISADMLQAAGLTAAAGSTVGR